MINHFKVKKHKGISELALDDLGHISVICGKNNSGKTSILEALTKPDKYSIGRKVDDLKWLESLFDPLANGYTNPSPSMGKSWFKRYVSDLISKEVIWYSDEFKRIENDFSDDAKKDPYLQSYGRDIYHFKTVLDKYFQNSLSHFKPILIPPKRKLETKVEILLKQDVNSYGEGLTNRLFYLKNQDSNSNEYKMFDKIYQAMEDITGYVFNVIPDQDNSITLYFRRKNEKWIEADSCGLGLCDVLIIICQCVDSNYTLVLIEEPESHLHPEIQKKLLSFIKSIKSKQFILSTHSSVFLDPYSVDKIYYCTFQTDVKLTDETSKSEILINLGYSVADNFVADVVVLTEGPTDIPIISTICKWMGFGDNYNLKYWPLGGDIMAGLDLSIFAERNNVIALIDSDPGSKIIRTRFERNCKQYGIKCHKLKRYSIENYFTLDAIKKVFPHDIPLKLIDLKLDRSVDEQIGFIKNGKKSKSIKWKNHDIISQMQLSDVQGTDLYQFCIDISNLCKR
ncbi:ATP-dependent nuclease [Desulfosporosinus nitroreducens]|uniref:ATP-binding protein n=1 Tax=Desulfosporosinus nitroreducens TaxID=2018668 RepID=A0ABT8QP46_9FIRM|nr:ATP-binding protein [Desulfosporosinus nitroreducens]MDO0823091.1 ATP-binding protein [Desulfosporosinus nitroreducens]